MTNLSIFAPDREDMLTRAAQGIEPSAHKLRKLAATLRSTARDEEDFAVILHLEREARRIEQLHKGAITIEYRGADIWRFMSRRLDADEFWRGEHSATYQKAKTAAGSDHHVGGTVSNLTTRHATYPGSPRPIDMPGTEGTHALVDALCAPCTRIELSGVAYDTARMQNIRARKAWSGARSKHVAVAVDHVRVAKEGNVICVVFEPPDSWDTAFIRSKRTLPNAATRNAA